MAKEISIGVDAAHLEAFAKAVENNPNIDFRSFNPHLAMRCRITDELKRNGSARVSANTNGGALDVVVNGNRVDQGGAITRQSLEFVVNVFSPGKGSKITALMLGKGATLVLRNPSSSLSG